MRVSMLARWPLVAGFALIVGACSDLTEVNKDPNAPTDVDAQFLLPQSLRSAVEQVFGDFHLLSHTSIWAQQTAQIQYPDEEQGLVRPENMSGFWNSYYSSSLRDIQAVIDKGRATNRPNVEAVGLIWKTWIFHQVTDLWGEVPYTEALRADQGITTPVYDTQRAIFLDMIQTLKNAEALLTPGGLGFGPGDILYGNDFEKWRRFSVSLRMRLAMRLSEVEPATAAAEFVLANTAGGFLSNADNAMFQWPGPPYENPLYENFTGRDDHGMSKRMIDTLVSLSDPRLELYAEPAKQDLPAIVYRGLQNNYAVPPLSIAYYSRIGNFWRRDGAATPTAIMTYSEVLFLQAEAAERGWIAGVAATLYEAAIRANMTQYRLAPVPPVNGPTNAEIDAYVVQASVVYTPGAAGLQQIQFQKWLSLFMQGSEAYANQRRTDLPTLVVGPNLTTSRVPVRFSYPGGEQSLNGANLAVAVARQPGGLSLVDRVWWDIN